MQRFASLLFLIRSSNHTTSKQKHANILSTSQGGSTWCASGKGSSCGQGRAEETSSGEARCNLIHCKVIQNVIVHSTGVADGEDDQRCLDNSKQDKSGQSMMDDPSKWNGTVAFYSCKQDAGRMMALLGGLVLARFCDGQSD